MPRDSAPPPKFLDHPGRRPSGMVQSAALALSWRMRVTPVSSFVRPPDVRAAGSGVGQDTCVSWAWPHL